MFRLSKTTDYGIVLLAQLALGADSDDESAIPSKTNVSSETNVASETNVTSVPGPRRREWPSQNARELAEASDLPVPMVSKILKALAREGILVSQRGAKGGYSLACAPQELSVARMIRVLEGPVSLTDCAVGESVCEHETLCAMREPWQVINRAVERSLGEITLADLVHGRLTMGKRSAGSPGHGNVVSEMLQIDRSPDQTPADPTPLTAQTPQTHPTPQTPQSGRSASLDETPSRKEPIHG